MTAKIRLEMILMTCPERKNTLAATLQSLAQTDWDSDIFTIIDDGDGSPSLKRMAKTFVRSMALASHSTADFILLVEDDIRFNLYLEHNVRSWLESFRAQDVGSLYRSNIGRMVGSQALVTSAPNWMRLHELATKAINLPAEPWSAPECARLDALATTTVNFQPHDLWLREQVPSKSFRIHTPSLVQHAPYSSTVGHPNHIASNFNLDWRYGR